jgi:PhnB protein
MSRTTSGIPEGYPSLSPYLIMRDAASAIDFYKRAFGATELLRLRHADGRIMQAEIRIGNSVVMLVDENPKYPEMRSALSVGGSPVQMHLYVADVDAAITQASAAGAKVVMPAKTGEDGERRGGVQDPFGLTWWIATVVKAMTREEMQKMYDEKMAAK